MKITSIEPYPVWGGERNFLFVIVDTDEGVYGVGEAGITGRELAVMGTIEHFEPLLLGEDPLRTEHLRSGIAWFATRTTRKPALTRPRWLSPA